MNPSRRRKKRPNYGIRTVEVMRGPNGFGFTISGQQPCILSCIVGNSPADQAGLRAGDFLISVNGLSVSKSTHDSVVNLIGNSIGPIKMTIAENYYSDSSDEEIDMCRAVSNRKPKYNHRPRGHRNYKHEANSSATDGLGLNSPTKKVMKLREAVMKNHVKLTQRDAVVSCNVFNADDTHNIQDLNVSNPVPMEDEAGPIEYKTVVGYLGTIEMPKQLLPGSRLQTVCSCIRKLRQEKRSPTAVLMTILPTCLTLKNASNHILAIYPTNRVVYIGSTSDKDSRYFGLVTSAVCDNRTVESVSKMYNDSQYQQIWPSETDTKKCNNMEDKNDIEISNSCHVFVTDPKLIEHAVHVKKAELFKIFCTPDIVTGNCLEFPKNALYIVSLVQNLYKLQDSTSNQAENRLSNDNNPVANSPQPSASSNSDSGIGFRDDCANVSDRILVVEFPAQRPFPIISNNSKRPSGIDASHMVLEGLNLPLNNDASNAKQVKHIDINNIRCKNNFEFKRPNVSAKNMNSNAYSSSTVFNEDSLQNKENKPNNNVNNIRACENVNVNNKNFAEYVNRNQERNDASAKSVDNLDQLMESPMKSLPNVQIISATFSENSGTNRLTVRAMPDPRGLIVSVGVTCLNNSVSNTCRNADIDTGQIFSERPIDVPENSPSKKSYESISLHSVNEETDDFKSSMDNVSVHSSKSIELSNLKNIFKTPSAKYLENKKSSKRHLKTLGSCDSLITDKYERSVLNYKLSPKVYGVAKPKNYSCEELSTLDNIEKCSYGSLQDLCSWVGQNGTKRHIAQSEPDVRLQRLRQDSATDNMCEENGIQNCTSTDGAASWATSFEKLLEDPLGLQTFAEFLKKEFSAENIYFWTACERYRRLPQGHERITEAQRIYQRHLCVGAPEPVNVDSQGRQCTEQSLQDANHQLFEQAQKQIFNLMKFDSYPRFLKSDLYKQCLSGNIDAQIDTGLLLHPSNATPSKLKKSLSNAEDRRRKSLLPWHRKIRSKSKDRGETEYTQKKDDMSENSTNNGKYDSGDVHSSKSSLTSLGSSKGVQDDCSFSANSARGALCRVILSNGSTTVVQIKHSETIEQLVTRVLDKRGITYSCFEVFSDKHSKSLNITESSAVLAGCEVKIEQRVVFKLDLPNRKIIAVKSKYTKILMDVLKPILNKYDYKLDQVNVTIGGTELVDITQPVTSVDGMRLNIQLCDGQKEMAAVPTSKTNNNNKPSNTSLDEITNKVFKELLHEKADSKCAKPRSDRGSVKSEDWGSEHSSGIFGRFLRRDSGMHDKKKKNLVARSKGNSTHSSVEDVAGESSMVAAKKPLIAKWKSGVNKLHVACSESDELYEGLKRAQRSRLEDQRGTEINFELPDFLKDKENAQHSNSRVRKLRRTGEGFVAENSRFYESEVIAQSKMDRPVYPVAATRSLKTEAHCNYENRNIMPHISSTNNNTYCVNNNTKLNNLRIYSPNKCAPNDISYSKASKCNSVESANLESTSKDHCESPKSSEPPPLPPKPKILPIKPSNWGQNGLFKSRVQKSDCPKPQGLYLEQPTSSFV